MRMSPLSARIATAALPPTVPENTPPVPGGGTLQDPADPHEPLEPHPTRSELPVITTAGSMLL
jgi:hypothetical protein